MTTTPIKTILSCLLLVLSVLQTPCHAQKQEKPKRQGWDPAKFFSKLDKNENGSIDPSELSDRSRGMIEKLGFDASASIPINRIAQQINAEKTVMARDANKKAWEKHRQVPGFDVVTRYPDVPGFDIDIKLPSVPDFSDTKSAAKEDADGEDDESERGFRRRGRGRGRDRGRGRGRDRDSRREDSSEKDSKPKKAPTKRKKTSPKEKAKTYVDSMLKKHDENEDGQFDKGELENVKLKLKDFDGDGQISREEAIAFVSGESESYETKRTPYEARVASQEGSSKRPKKSRRRDRSVGAREDDREGESSEPTSIRRDVRGFERVRDQNERTTGDTDARSDRFSRLDKNQDGQVQMAEFAAPDEWTPDKIADFYEIDRDRDGLITRDEWDA